MKRLLESAVLASVGHERTNYVGPPWRLLRLHAEARLWIARPVDQHDPAAWCGSFDWCCHHLTVHGCRNLFGALTYSGASSLGLPNIEQLREALRKLPEAGYIEELRKVLLNYVDSNWSAVLAAARRPRVPRMARPAPQRPPELQQGIWAGV